MNIKISSTLYAKQIKKELIAKNKIVYDGGLGENPLPAPKILVDTINKKNDIYIKKFFK